VAKQVPVSRDLQVFVGGVSDGRLQRGDVVTAIQHYDATQIPHRQAEDIIRAARDTLSISVRRSAARWTK